MATVVASWWAVIRHIRCPVCDRWAYPLWAWSYSLFARASDGRCRGCNTELFDARTRRRGMRLIIGSPSRRRSWDSWRPCP